MGRADRVGSPGSIDRSMIENIVRQVALEHFGKGKTGANAAVTAVFEESPSAPSSVQRSANSESAQNHPAPDPKLFFTPEAEEIKKEICAVGSQALAAPICRRQRRQHFLPHRSQRVYLHADHGE